MENLEITKIIMKNRVLGAFGDKSPMLLHIVICFLEY